MPFLVRSYHRAKLFVRWVHRSLQLYTQVLSIIGRIHIGDRIIPIENLLPISGRHLKLWIDRLVKSTVKLGRAWGHRFLKQLFFELQKGSITNLAVRILNLPFCQPYIFHLLVQLCLRAPPLNLLELFHGCYVLLELAFKSI